MITTGPLGETRAPAAADRPARWASVIGLVVLVSVLALPIPVRAWSSLGHETAGLIAAERLAPDTARRVNALLGSESLAEASTWADRMRSDPAPFWQEEAGPYHYVTVPPGRRYADVGAPPEGDAVTALDMFAAELCAPDTRPERRHLALRFALHIIQDLQQPLHVGNGRDRGGNDVQVTVAGEPSNLHRVWDRTVLESAGLQRSALRDRLRRDGLLDLDPGSADPARWIRESASLREELYPPPGVIDDAYLRRWLPTVQRRVALAGLRSAAWLDATFSTCPGPAPAPRRR